jgi:hypothetical protein
VVEGAAGQGVGERGLVFEGLFESLRA